MRSLRRSATNPVPPRRSAASPWRGAAAAATKTSTNTGGIIGRLALVLLANLGALSALLVYFGWRRSKTQAQALGIDESLLDMTTQEYVLRSVGPVFGLLTLLVAVGVTWVWIDNTIIQVINKRPSSARWVSRALILTCPAPLLITYLAAARWNAQAFVLFPLSIAAGALLLLYRIELNQKRGCTPMPRHDFLRGLVALASAACLFWSATNYAIVLGYGLAEDFETTLSEQVRVVIYSTEPLHLDSPGIRTDIIDVDRTPYRYRYSGLRMMDRRGGRYFLVSETWTSQQGVVIVLRDDDKIRAEFSRT
jgi:hypothetical protein